MANKTFSIINTRKEIKENQNDIVYSDISLVSSPNSYYVHDNALQIEQSKYSIDKSINVQAIHNSLHNLFTWVPGERILYPLWGNRLYHFLYNGITDMNIEAIVGEIRGIVSEEEPRVRIVDIIQNINSYNVEDNTINLDILYTIKGLEGKTFTYSYTFNKV